MHRRDGSSGELREFLRVAQRDGRICAFTVFVLLAMIADLINQHVQEGAYLRLCGGCLLLITIGAHLVEQRRLADIVRARLCRGDRSPNFESSCIDPLTHVYNHRHLRDAVMAREAEVAAGRSYSLVLVDIDDLSGFNRTAGRCKGDEVLQFMASLLKLNVRPDDVVLRIDGDEFLAIVNTDDVAALVSHVRAGADDGPVKYVIHTSVWDGSRSFEAALQEAEDAVRQCGRASSLASPRLEMCPA